jgi:hypothetical protein
MAMSGRTALDIIVADAREAGGGAAISAAGVDLARVLSPVVPHDELESGLIVQSGSAVTLRTAPHLAAQARLRADVAAGDTFLPIETSMRCPSGPPACGFQEGDTAVLFTALVAEVVRIGSSVPGAVVLESPLTVSFPIDAVLCRLATTTYGLRSDGTLVKVTAAGAEQPLVDNVVRFEVGVDDADVSRARLMSLLLRMEAASADLRGPAGYLFTNAGTSQDSRRWLPDVELRTQVSIRNAGATW